ncbi:anaphase promoting complex subunit 8 [Heterostelium album PN500]|uniref:Anaphase promoting complex subunit 8 n=1 Tax=Heterostelium pallidum (strain ATCC 26659 / Pp 5 / PN500) TaxID=670386 RepID=D3B7T3_HETP5|nr:anaphase promoting complex subunit 8 [Heterostelium album PN500]EFA82826.1 anaphase promoting complex subunit 8 [Heterostelium album PN500]|eukprot:XP_020434943.1 anaphase promoting complex subunit 8 [Heterostelium album PN500]
MGMSSTILMMGNTVAMQKRGVDFRGLYLSSKWSSEQLNGLDSQVFNSSNNDNNSSDNHVDQDCLDIDIEIKCKIHNTYDCIAYCLDCNTEICQCCVVVGSHSRHEFVGLSDSSVSSRTEREKEVRSNSTIKYGSEEHVKYTLAKSYFDLKEYRRCADVLEHQSCRSSLSLFLQWYSLYLAYEKRSLEESIESKESTSGGSNNSSNNNSGTSGSSSSPSSGNGSGGNNPSNDGNVNTQLDGGMDKNTAGGKSGGSANNSGGGGGGGNAEVTREMLQLSNKMEQWYRNTGEQCQDAFLLYLYAVILKKNNNIASAKQVLALSIYNNLSKTFPNSTYIAAQNAIGHYNLREYGVAEELFEKILEIEPHRLESIDVYSNILYVHNNKANLSMLAHKAMTTEKYSPETCCIIGNYYSLKSEHDKAILYFQRALKLNDKYLAAWTLIGHEFLEIKNVAAAINAYRKAVDINSKDYRAWYGLGQTYQLLKLPLYSLYYFQKATAIHPYDPRMWCAVAGCYEILERIPDAIRCYERAEENYDRERVALSKLAKLYQDMQRNEEAAYYYKKNLYHRDNEKIDGQETIDALHFLAHHHKKLGQFDQAEKYCLRLLDYAGPEKEEAKALLKDIRVGNQQIQQQQQKQNQ